MYIFTSWQMHLSVSEGLCMWKNKSAKKDADTLNVGLCFCFYFYFLVLQSGEKKKTWKKQHRNNCYYDSAEETQPQSSTLFHKGFSQLKTKKNSLWKTFVLNIIGH